MSDSDESAREDTALQSDSGPQDAIKRPTLMQLIMMEDLQGFRYALTRAKIEQINAEYDRSYTCLEYAIESDLVDFVPYLLKYGADPQRYNTTRDGNAILFAAKKGQDKVLKWFLLRDIDLRCTNNRGRNALHLVVETGVASLKTSMDNGRILRCLNILLEDTRMDIDLVDNDGVTPLHLAVVGGWWEGVEAILKHEPDLDVEVEGRTAREVLEYDCPDLLKLAKPKGTLKPRWNYLKKMMFKALYDRDTGNFVSMVQDASDLNADVVIYTFLQLACKNGLYECVKTLLDNGAEPDKTCRKNHFAPVAIAAAYGYHKILSCLLRTKADITKSSASSKQTVLHLIALRGFPCMGKDQDYDKCLEEVMKNQPEIDARDRFGNTALHYAAGNGNKKTIITLLHAGASWGAKSYLGEIPLSIIPPETIQQFLDECIVEPDKAPKSEEIQLTFKYEFLEPRRKASSAGSNPDPEKQDSETHDPNLSETKELWYLWHSSKHQNLLKHPVLSSFLHLKFQCIRNLYYFNLLVHTIFVLLLTYYLHLSFATSEPGSQSSRYVIASVNAIFFLFIVLREVIQMSVSLKRYMISFENICESVLIVLTILVVYCPIKIESRRHLAPFLMLLAWCEVLFILGQHPSLSTYMTMFGTVSISYLKFLATFSVLICAFALSFSLVFYKCERASDCDAFHYFPTSVLRTCVMMFGEFEFGSLPFFVLPGTSQLIFFLFIFLVVTVLLNLLNGLAVSDTQAILDRAELIGCGSRLQLISYIECTALGEPMPFFSKWGPFEWMRQLPDCSLYSVCHKVPKLRRLMRRFKFGNTVLLFPRLPNMQLNVTFSDTIKVRPESFYLDKPVAEAARGVVLEKKRRAKENIGSRDIQERLDTLEKNMKSITEKMRSDMEKISSNMERMCSNMESMSNKMDALIRGMEAKDGD